MIPNLDNIHFYILFCFAFYMFTIRHTIVIKTLLFL